jgi:hypothetical protein
MPTIGRNRRQYVANVKALFTDCHRYNTQTGEMDACPASEAWDLLLSEDNKKARLIENEDGTIYTISNQYTWYELRRPA